MEDADQDVWLEYLSAKRESYLVERRRLLGPEYALDPQRWDALLEQEWLIMRDRLAAGHDVEDPIKRQLGEDFFERQLMEQLESEFHQVASDFEEIQWQDRLLPFVYYEDFVMLAQQGIFRLEEFIFDKGRRWEKKVLETLTSYGYQCVGHIELVEEVYLHVVKG